MGALLVLEWCQHSDRVELPLLVHTFDGGTMSSTDAIHLPRDELGDYGYFGRDEADLPLATTPPGRCQPVL